ncbi:hypothetical protein HY837_00015 [archaeon]|nr:hypothetical protein [archaeon]
MADEGRGLALVILGIVAVIAVVGLVLLFVGARSTGQATTVGYYDPSGMGRFGGSPVWETQTWGRDVAYPGGPDAYYRIDTSDNGARLTRGSNSAVNQQWVGSTEPAISREGPTGANSPLYG